MPFSQVVGNKVIETMMRWMEFYLALFVLNVSLGEQHSLCVHPWKKVWRRCWPAGFLPSPEQLLGTHRCFTAVWESWKCFNRNSSEFFYFMGCNKVSLWAWCKPQKNPWELKYFWSSSAFFFLFGTGIGSHSSSAGRCLWPCYWE